MSEGEWHACSNIKAMLDLVAATTTERKLRLFGCACCRAIWWAFTEPNGRFAVETAESFADGRATAEELAQAQSESRAVWSKGQQCRAAALDMAVISQVASQETPYYPATYRLAYFARDMVSDKEPLDISERRQCNLLRCIVGNPFRTITAEPLLPTPEIVSLAMTIYEARSFDRLLELVAALQSHGCVDADLLAHLRGPNAHARGCWAVDCVLGKA